jgi:hypothetical protein
MQNVGGIVLKIWMFAMLFPYMAIALGRASLQQFSSELKSRDEIHQLFKDSSSLEKAPSDQLAKVLKSNEKSLTQLLKEFDQSGNFVRGEIEDEKVLGGLMTYLQLSMVKARSDALQNRWAEVQKNLGSWFQFAADFPFEESSLVGLRLTGVIRSLLLDELEKMQAKFPAELAMNPEFRKWFLQVRAPWPVDRVLISEAKRLLKPPMMSVANAAAKAFQKNPYQTSAQALARVKGGQSESAEVLKKIWREADIEMMKAEINRIGKMKLRLAKNEFEAQNKKAPRTAEDLVKAGLLDRVPTDYFTGKPLDLTSL